MVERIKSRVSLIEERISQSRL